MISVQIYFAIFQITPAIQLDLQYLVSSYKSVQHGTVTLNKLVDLSSKMEVFLSIAMCNSDKVNGSIFSVTRQAPLYSNYKCTHLL